MTLKVSEMTEAVGWMAHLQAALGVQQAGRAARGELTYMVTMLIFPKDAVLITIAYVCNENAGQVLTLVSVVRTVAGSRGSVLEVSEYFRYRVASHHNLSEQLL